MSIGSRLLAAAAIVLASQGVCAPEAQAQRGAVYTMTNSVDGNAIAAFGRGSDGSLSFIGNYPTDGLGSTEFDGGEGLDPLISADSIIVTDNQRFLLAVNAGSDSITSFRINRDFGLTRISTISSGGVGPNSLAYNRGRVFVSNIDRDGTSPDGGPRGEPNDEGNVVGFWLTGSGRLFRINGATADLDNRPADVGFSTDGSKLVVTSITAGSAALTGENAANSVSVFNVLRSGRLSSLAGSATGTQVGNEEGRNLASAIDFDITTVGGREFVVVTEAREFNSEGAPPALPALQAGSISVYELDRSGSLTSIVQDLALGDPTGSPFDPSNQLTSCWIDFGSDRRTFYVSNAINASISQYELGSDGVPTLIDAVAATGTSGFAEGGTTGPEVFGITDGYIDLDVTDDGRFLYQLAGLSGAIEVYSINRDGSLADVQSVTGFLPEEDTQGLVTVSDARTAFFNSIKLYIIRFLFTIKQFFNF
ncbi:MAG: hypothetical protein ABJZ55_22085 [Fuerstiella sp.]